MKTIQKLALLLLAVHLPMLDPSAPYTVAYGQNQRQSGNKSFKVTGTGGSTELIVNKRYYDWKKGELEDRFDENGKFIPGKLTDWDKHYHRYTRIKPPTWKLDCAGYVLEQVWGISPHWVTAPQLFNNVIAKFGKKISGLTGWGDVRPNDIVAWRKEGRVGHVTVVRAVDSSGIIIETKNNEEPVYKIDLRKVDITTFPIRSYDPLVRSFGLPEIWRVDPSQVKIEPFASVEFDEDDPNLKRLTLLEEQVAGIPKLKGDLFNSIESIKENADKVIKAEAEAKKLLDQLKSLQPIIGKIKNFCEEIAPKRREMQTKAMEAGKLGDVLRDTLDSASKLAANCTSSADVAAIQDKYKNAFRMFQEIGMLKQEVSKLGADLKNLAPSLLPLLQKLDSTDELLQAIETQSNAAANAFEAARKDFNQSVALAEELRELPKEVRADLKEIEDDYPELIPSYIKPRIDQLRSRLANMDTKQHETATPLPEDIAARAQQYMAEAEEIGKKYLSSLSSVCSIDPIVEKETIDGVLTVAALAIHAAADLIQKAKDCEAKLNCQKAIAAIQGLLDQGDMMSAAQEIIRLKNLGCDTKEIEARYARLACQMAIVAIELLLDQGDTEGAAPQINKLKTTGCNTREIEDLYWRVHAKVWPLLARARDAWNNAGNTCDYKAALSAAQALQSEFPNHPWLTQNLPDIQKAAKAQEEMDKLLQRAIEADEGIKRLTYPDNRNPVYVEVKKPNSLEAEAAIAQAERVAAPFPCLNKVVEKFKNEYQKGRNLASNIASLRARIGALVKMKGELQAVKVLADTSAQAAKGSADTAAAQLTRMKGINDQITQASRSCNSAASLKAKIESASSDATTKEGRIRRDLDEAIKKAASCTSRADAADVQNKYNNAIQTLGQIGAGVQAAKAANEDLRRLLTQSEKGKEAVQRAMEMADRIATESGNANSSVTSARTAAERGEALLSTLLSSVGQLRGELQALYTPTLPNDFAQELSGLQALLNSASVNPGDFNFKGGMTAAESEVTRCNGFKAEAQALLAKYQDVVTCNVTAADDDVSKIDGMVTGLMIELAAAADAVKKAADCLRRMETTDKLPDALDPNKDPNKDGDRQPTDQLPDALGPNKNEHKPPTSDVPAVLDPGKGRDQRPTSTLPDALSTSGRTLDQTPTDKVPDVLEPNTRDNQQTTSDVPSIVSNTTPGHRSSTGAASNSSGHATTGESPSDKVPDFIGSTGRGTRPNASGAPDMAGNTGTGTKPSGAERETSNAPPSRNPEEWGPDHLSGVWLLEVSRLNNRYYQKWQLRLVRTSKNEWRGQPQVLEYKIGGSAVEVSGASENYSHYKIESDDQIKLRIYFGGGHSLETATGLRPYTWTFVRESIFGNSQLIFEAEGDPGHSGPPGSIRGTRQGH